MSKKIKACTIQNDSYILYPRTVDVLVVNEEGESLKDRFEAISEKVDNIIDGKIDIVIDGGVSKDYVNNIIDELKSSTEDEIDLIANQINDILNANKQQEILKLTVDDIGKVLSVAQNDKGELITKAIDIILNPDNISVEWEQIQNKPELASRLNIKQNELVLQSDINDLSSVPLVIDEDIDNIISEL